MELDHFAGSSEILLSKSYRTDPVLDLWIESFLWVQSFPCSRRKKSESESKSKKSSKLQLQGKYYYDEATRTCSCSCSCSLYL